VEKEPKKTVGPGRARLRPPRGHGFGAATLLAEGLRPEEFAFAVEGAITQMPGGTSLGLMPTIMHQALQARDDVPHAAAAPREAAARIDEQLRREKALQEQRRRLAALRAAVSAASLAALRAQAREALAREGRDHTRVGDERLLKLTVEERMEQRFLARAGAGEAHQMAAVQPGLFAAGG
jgi:alkylhydroperoxidase/carboxymuconolactone decarboxylase family protein YurZ